MEGIVFWGFWVGVWLVVFALKFPLWGESNVTGARYLSHSRRKPAYQMHTTRLVMPSVATLPLATGT